MTKAMTPEEQRQRFDALIRESKLNNDPSGSPDEYALGKLAMEFVATPESNAVRREELRNQMANISVRMMSDPQRRVWHHEERSDPGPHWQLAKDLLDASIERDRLGVDPPAVLSSLPRGPCSEGEIGDRVHGILLRSVGESRVACDAAKEAAKRAQAPTNGDHR